MTRNPNKGWGLALEIEGGFSGAYLSYKRFFSAADKVKVTWIMYLGSHTVNYCFSHKHTNTETHTPTYTHRHTGTDTDTGTHLESTPVSI